MIVSVQFDDNDSHDKRKMDLLFGQNDSEAHFEAICMKFVYKLETELSDENKSKYSQEQLQGLKLARQLFQDAGGM
jgi:hypothetical protein